MVMKNIYIVQPFPLPFLFSIKWLSENIPTNTEHILCIYIYICIHVYVYYVCVCGIHPCVLPPYEAAKQTRMPVMLWPELGPA